MIYLLLKVYYIRMMIIKMIFNNINNTENNKITKNIINDLLLLFDLNSYYQFYEIHLAKYII